MVNKFSCHWTQWFMSWYKDVLQLTERFSCLYKGLGQLAVAISYKTNIFIKI